jgi:hypothetical protein
MPRRPLALLIALVVGVTFAAGLFIQSRLGGGLLLFVDVLLIAMASLTWSRLSTRGRPMRIAVIAVIGVLGVVKLVHG